MPATAMAHPGHPEAAGPMGHDIAHVVIAVGLATAAVIVAGGVRKALGQRED